MKRLEDSTWYHEDAQTTNPTVDATQNLDLIAQRFAWVDKAFQVMWTFTVLYWTLTYKMSEFEYALALVVWIGVLALYQMLKPRIILCFIGTT